jgi:phosphodiesterase/alkaline phosphatase D-like protein
MAQIWFRAIPERPTVTTGEATSIDFTSVRLNGSVNPNGSVTTYRFEYGTTTAYGSSTPNTNAGSGTSALGVNTSVTGLTSGTPYHYRLRATNSAGTAFGADQTFTTQSSSLPDVTTGEATSIGFTSVRLNGSVNPNGRATTYCFEYGTTSAYGSCTPNTSAGSGTSTLTVNTSVTGLVNETPYHYRLKATNSVGTAFGADRTFTTHRPSCEGCHEDEVVLSGVTYGPDTDCECIAATSITIGSDVTIESGAKVTFSAPRVVIQSGFLAENGSVVEIITP